MAGSSSGDYSDEGDPVLHRWGLHSQDQSSENDSSSTQSSPSLEPERRKDGSLDSLDEDDETYVVGTRTDESDYRSESTASTFRQTRGAKARTVGRPARRRPDGFMQHISGRKSKSSRRPPPQVRGYEVATESYKRSLDTEGKPSTRRKAVRREFSGKVQVHQHPPDVQCERVSVSARVRPPNDKDGATERLEVLPDSRLVCVLPSGPSHSEKRFRFDHVFADDTTQAEVLRATVAPFVDGVIAGVSACVLAYGQTGAGKTYTVFGPDINSRRVSRENTKELGLIPRAMFHLFEAIESNSDKFEFSVSVEYLQVYMETVQDLLRSDLKNLDIREGPDGWFVDGLSSHQVDSVHRVLAVLEAGAKRKAVAKTALNIESSRSHTLFSVTVRRKLRHPVNHGADGAGDNGSARILKAKLTFVDLAGSERTSRTHATGIALEEAKAINKSLSALGNVVASLSERSAGRAKFVPWRDSKLTRLLQDSLAGRSRIHLILALSPDDDSLAETKNTLDFGHRAQSVQLSPEVNERVDYRALCAQQQAQIDQLLDRQRQQSSVMIKRFEEVEVANSKLRDELNEERRRRELAARDAGAAKSAKELAEAEREGLQAEVAALRHKLSEAETASKETAASREKLLEEALLEQGTVNENLANAAKLWADERESLTQQVERLTDALSQTLDARVTQASAVQGAEPSPADMAARTHLEAMVSTLQAELGRMHGELATAHASMQQKSDEIDLLKREHEPDTTSEASEVVVRTGAALEHRMHKLEKANKALHGSQKRTERRNFSLQERVTTLQRKLDDLAETSDSFTMSETTGGGDSGGILKVAGPQTTAAVVGTPMQHGRGNSVAAPAPVPRSTLRPISATIALPSGHQPIRSAVRDTKSPEPATAVERGHTSFRPREGSQARTVSRDHVQLDVPPQHSLAYVKATSPRTPTTGIDAGELGSSCLKSAEEDSEALSQALQNTRFALSRALAAISDNWQNGSPRSEAPDGPTTPARAPSARALPTTSPSGILHRLQSPTARASIESMEAAQRRDSAASPGTTMTSNPLMFSRAT